MDRVAIYIVKRKLLEVAISINLIMRHLEVTGKILVERSSVALIEILDLSWGTVGVKR